MNTGTRKQRIEFPEQDLEFAMSLCPTTEEVLKDLCISIEDVQYELINALCRTLNIRYLGLGRFFANENTVVIDIEKERAMISTMIVRLLATSGIPTHVDENETARKVVNSWFKIVAIKLQKKRTETAN